jgi:hypothetical protein
VEHFSRVAGASGTSRLRAEGCSDSRAPAKSATCDAVGINSSERPSSLLRDCETMSPESELRSPTDGSQASTPDALQHASDAPEPRLVRSGRASGRLPKARATGLSWLWGAFDFVAVASAAVYVVGGLWQVNAIISRSQEAAREAVIRHTAAPAPLSASAQPSPGDRRSPPVPAEVVATPTAVMRTAGAASDKGAARSTDPVLTATGNVSKAGAAASTFEAQAEASERVVSLGLDAAELDGTAGALTLGQPPPPDYPRVDCKDIFVYIVTIADGAPERSAASIGVGKKGPARFRRPGEGIGDWTVLAITDDWSGLNPDVWLEKDGTVCQAELAGNPSRIQHTPKKPLPRSKARRRRR